MTGESRLQASRLALLSVILIVGGSFYWWYRNRPSYLLFQAHKEMGQGNQAAVIAEYRRLLSRPGLTKQDEIRFRKALGELYIRALQETLGISAFKRDPNEVENPFVADAKKEFDRIIELDSTDSDAHYYLGRIYAFRQLEAFALEELNLSRKYNPKNAEPLWFMAQLELERGHATIARELALQALAILPDFDQARLTLVESYALLGDMSSALDQYDQLSSIFKSNPNTQAKYALFLAQANEWGQANSVIQEASRQAPSNPEVKIVYGQLLLEQGKWDEAAGQLAQGSALMPKNVWPLLWQTKAFFLRGDCNEANRFAQILVEGLPRWGWAYLAQAWGFLCRQDEAHALSSLDEALRLSPELMEALRLKARILADRQQFHELGLLIRNMIDRKQYQSEAYDLLAESFFQQNNYTTAQEMAETAIKLNQRNAHALARLALIRHKLGETEGANRAAESAIRLRPFDPDIQSIAQTIKNPIELEGLTNRYPQNPLVWLMYAQFARSEKKLADALRAFQEALNIKPYLLDAQLGLIEVSYQLGQREKADAALNAAIKINSKHKEVLKWRAKLRNDR